MAGTTTTLCFVVPQALTGVLQSSETIVHVLMLQYAVRRQISWGRLRDPQGPESSGEEGASWGLRSRRPSGPSPGLLPRDEYKDPANGNQPVLEGGHGEDGELGPALQGENRQEPPVPGGATG